LIERSKKKFRLTRSTIRASKSCRHMRRCTAACRS
jgi:hypothetical protein